MERKLILSDATTVSARTIMVAEIEALLEAVPGFGVPRRDYEQTVLDEKYCAEGRMLFLSRYPVLDRLPPKSEFYRRCHEMGDIVVNGLTVWGVSKWNCENCKGLLAILMKSSTHSAFSARSA